MTELNREPCLIQGPDGSIVVGIVGRDDDLSAVNSCRVTIDQKAKVFSGVDTVRNRELFSFSLNTPQIDKAIDIAMRGRTPKINIWEATAGGLHFFTKIEFVLI